MAVRAFAAAARVLFKLSATPTRAQGPPPGSSQHAGVVSRLREERVV